MVTIVHIEELLDIEDHGERDRQLRRYLAPYSAEIGVDGAEKILRREIDPSKHADLLANIKTEF